MPGPVLRASMVLACCGGVLSASAGPQGQPPRQPTARGAIVGRVIDTARAGVPRAMVTLYLTITPQGQRTHLPFPRLALADEHGDFVFTELPIGQYSLQAAKDGYIYGRYERSRHASSTNDLTLGDGERRLDVTITLTKYSVVSGAVVDDTNSPLIGMNVSVYRPVLRSGHQRFEMVRSAMSDDRGEYRITGLEPGRYVVATQGNSQPLIVPNPNGQGTRTLVYPPVLHPMAAHGAASELIVIEAGQQISGVNFRIDAVPAARVTGVLSGGDPSSMTHLRLKPQDDRFPGIAREHQSAPDPSGRFVFDGVLPGAYVLEASRVPVQPAVEQQPQTIIQTSSGTSSMWVNLTGRDELPPVRPVRPSWAATMPVVVGDTGVDNLVVTLQDGPKISGRITFDGTATPPTAPELRRFRLQIEPAEGGWSAANVDTVVNDKGEFVISGLIPGRFILRSLGSFNRWTLRGVMVDGRDVSIVPIDLGIANVNDVAVVFTDRLTVVHGVAVGIDGQPARDALVAVFPVDPQLWKDYGQTPRRLQSSGAMNEGMFSLAVPPGDYYLVATTDDLRDSWQDRTILTRLAALAERVTLREGDRQSLNLRVVSIR